MLNGTLWHVMKILVGVSRLSGAGGHGFMISKYHGAHPEVDPARKLFFGSGLVMDATRFGGARHFLARLADAS
jgi:hypothetical protein